MVEKEQTIGRMSHISHYMYPILKNFSVKFLVNSNNANEFNANNEINANNADK